MCLADQEEEEDGSLTVTVPEGSVAGDLITIETEDGREMDIEIPEGLVAGDAFSVTIGEGDDEEEDVEAVPPSDSVSLMIICPTGSQPGDLISIETDRCARCFSPTLLL